LRLEVPLGVDPIDCRHNNFFNVVKGTPRRALC